MQGSQRRSSGHGEAHAVDCVVLQVTRTYLVNTYCTGYVSTIRRFQCPPDGDCNMEESHPEAASSDRSLPLIGVEGRYFLVR